MDGEAGVDVSGIFVAGVAGECVVRHGSLRNRQGGVAFERDRRFGPGCREAPSFARDHYGLLGAEMPAEEDDVLGVAIECDFIAHLEFRAVPGYGSAPLAQAVITGRAVHDDFAARGVQATDGDGRHAAALLPTGIRDIFARVAQPFGEGGAKLQHVVADTGGVVGHH